MPMRMNAFRRLSAVVSLTVSLILSLSPLVLAPVAAAPPETTQEAPESSDITPDPGTKTEIPLDAETPQVAEDIRALLTSPLPDGARVEAVNEITFP